MGIQRIRGAMEKHMMSIKFNVIVEIVILVQTVFQFQLASPLVPSSTSVMLPLPQTLPLPLPLPVTMGQLRVLIGR